MEYSAPTPVSRGLSAPSPRSATIACANGNVLEIHHLHSCALLHSVTTAAPITHLAWGHSCSNGELIAAASSPENCVVVVAVATGAVLSDILDTPLAIDAMWFSPAPRSLLLVLHEKSFALNLFSAARCLHLATLPFPKTAPHLVHSFSPCASFVAVVTRRNGRESICILACNTGQLLRCIRLSQNVGVHDIVGVKWLPSNAALIVWGSTLTDPDSFAVLSLSGRLLRRGAPGGVPRAAYALGARLVCFNRSGSLMAMGGYDGVVAFVDTRRWELVKLFTHRAPEVCETHPATVYREQSQAGTREQTARCSHFEVVQYEGEVEISKRAGGFKRKTDGGRGIFAMQFSADGRYVCTSSAEKANVVFVWDVTKLRLTAVLILEEDVQTLRWSNRDDAEAELAIACGADCVYFWKNEGAAVATLSQHVRWRTRFRARKLRWAYDDSALVVTDGVSAKAFMTVFFERVS